jgi:hypothetical protein
MTYTPLLKPAAGGTGNTGFSAPISGTNGTLPYVESTANTYQSLSVYVDQPALLPADIALKAAPSAGLVAKAGEGQDLISGGQNITVEAGDGAAGASTSTFGTGGSVNIDAGVGTFVGSLSQYDGDINIGATTGKTITLGYTAVGDVGGNVVLAGATTVSNDIVVNTVKVGKSSSSGSGNILVGSSSAFGAVTTASNCVAIGANAQQNNQSGIRNVAVGTQALRANVSGTTNTAVGYFALDACTGSSNTAVGNSAGSNITTGSNLTCLGNGASPSLATASNEISLGNTAVTTLRVGNPNNTAPNPGLTATTVTTLPAWNIGHNANSAAAPFVTFLIAGAVSGGIRQAAGGGTPLVYATSSDYRIKTDVQPIADPLDRLVALKPCRFRFTTNPAGPLVEGFIAHEVQDVVPQAVVGTKDEVDADSNPVHQGLDQAHLVPLLTAACQALAARAQAAEARLAALEAIVASLQNAGG